MGVDLSGHLAGDDLEDLGAELDEQAVEGQLDLLVGRAALGLGVGDGLVDQSRVLGLLGGGEDERRVGRRVLRLVLADGWGSSVGARAVVGRGQGRGGMEASPTYRQSHLVKLLATGSHHRGRIGGDLPESLTTTFARGKRTSQLTILCPKQTVPVVTNPRPIRPSATRSHRASPRGRRMRGSHPPWRGRLTVPVALSCSRALDMVAVTGI